MRLSEPPGSPTAFPGHLFRVGRDSRGNWVAQDQRGLCGGLFVNRLNALKFALSENGNCAEAIVMVPGILELYMGGAPQRSSR
jgi:hypothetical protein